MNKTYLFSIRAGVDKEETISSYPRIILGVNITGTIGEEIPYPFFPSPPLVYHILLSSWDPIHVVCFSKLGEITQSTILKHKSTKYGLKTTTGGGEEMGELVLFKNNTILLTNHCTSNNGGIRNR
jgi:hypothetical protein